MNDEILIQEFETIKSQGWIKLNNQGYGSAGLLFERLLGISSNKLRHPDYFGIEIKTKYSKKEEYLSLYNLNPKSSNDYTIKYLVNNYGYKDKISNYKILNINLSCNYFKKTDKYMFKLNVDEIEKKMFLYIYDLNKQLIDSSIYWDFEDIIEKTTEKCTKLGFIQAERKVLNQERYVKYNTIRIYEYMESNKIIEELRKGTIRVCFKIGVHRTGEYQGEPNSHGTAFEIKVADLEKLFKRTY